MNSLFDIAALGTRLDSTVASMMVSKSSQSFPGVAPATDVQLEHDVRMTYNLYQLASAVFDQPF